MKHLYYVKKLIRIFNEKELNLLIDFLQFRDKKINHNDLLTLKALKLIIKNPDITGDTLKRKIYQQKVSKSTLNTLLSRLSDKMLESLILDANIQRKEKYSDYVRIEMDLKKKFAQSEILRNRGLYHETLDLYDKMLENAKQFELYNDAVEILRLKKSLKSRDFQKKEVVALKREIEFYERCRAAWQKAQDYYFEVLPNLIHQQTLNQDIRSYISTLEQVLDELKYDISYTNSHYIRFVRYLFQIEYYQQSRNYAYAYEVCKLLLDHVNHQTSVYLPSRKALAYISLAETGLLNYEFDETVVNASEAMIYFHPNTPNYSIAIELKFYAYFYSGQLHRAAAIIQELINRPNLNYSHTLMSKRKYFIACVYALLGYHHKAHLYLQETQEVEKMNPLWNVHVRFLNIINHLEAGQFDMAESKIISCRQYIYRVKPDEYIRQRERMILQLLVELMKANYDFEIILRNNKDAFELLKSDLADYRWEMKSPEMILFHEWFKAKALKAIYPRKLQPSSLHAKKVKAGELSTI